ncbi:hypothetical protein G6L37_05495 [Agrobacterium rubi]|nr:hypothetical protein [Agrobacterium rubi]NTF24812.1 hypothetical protein [Agrobacterium rubi]
MKSNNSGFVDVTSDDIDIAIAALLEEKLMVSYRTKHRVDEDGVRSFEADTAWLSLWLREFESMEPGRAYFAKADMERLRGIIFTGYKRNFAQRYRSAVMSCNSQFTHMIGRMQRIEEFEARMWDPEQAEDSVVAFDCITSHQEARYARG